ncbi:CO2 hydration protein [[Limnothrix rosea] IAM M-220]|uniref:CO2 hydration protein n=1 Tax=[Limnothrix rosea] IAM M-220 TaxID=454133 RepID=UPI00096654E5|nr:CO2 hydration protein [[Limnothrix rosea] IAM M-220]OKH16914.1 carbon dioxide transporter [[Limnothrix rosea] IAM M-220]
MVTALEPSRHPLAAYIHRLEQGLPMLDNSDQNVMEVIGILKSYGIVLDAYSNNLNYIAKHQFLKLFPFFKYFNGDINVKKLGQFWWHNRINYEYAEYCMKSMFWHGGGGLDAYVDSPEFEAAAKKAIAARWQNNPVMLGLNKLFPDFLLEQTRVMAYYTGLGQFWRVMSDMFLSLSDRYDAGEIKSTSDVTNHILAGLVADAAKPITYSVEIGGEKFDLIPESAGITFLIDTGVPYVEAIFFRGTPFPGIISYNAQARQISPEQSTFTYGALYADPLPIGGSGIPPTLLMQDMRHFLPDYLHNYYMETGRSEQDIRVKICQTFQKSMFCVTSATLIGLVPNGLNPDTLEKQQENRAFFESWMDRLLTSQIHAVNH